MKKTMVYQLTFFILFSYSLSLHCIELEAQRSGVNTGISFPVGVILDLETWLGRMANTCISMGVTDFYAAHSHYKTRLVLHIRDSKKDDVVAAFAAKSLVNDVQVDAIIGPQTSTQAEFVAELGGKSHVPIISFSATGHSLPFRTPYFIPMVPDDTYQAKAIAAIVQAFGWREVISIYEDTNYGSGVQPKLIDSFQNSDARITYGSAIPPFATKEEIFKELGNLMRMQGRVFIVHMTSLLGSRFFLMVKDVGLMSEGYVWIITEGLTNLLDSMEHSVINSMQGVLGIKPFVPQSRELDNFRYRYKKKIRRNNPNIGNVELSPYGLFVYDTVWALGMAAERVCSLNLSSQETKNVEETATDLTELRVSKIGPEFLEEILGTKFKGLSGELNLEDGQVQLHVYQIVNVNGKGEREIGFWTSSHGISRRLDVKRNYYSCLKDDLGPIIWPGESIEIPKGSVVPKVWEDSRIEKKLRIGVPVKEGFNEFVKVERDPSTHATDVTGYCIDVFNLVMGGLPFNVPYEFVPFQNANGESAGSYDDLVFQVYAQRYDAVVGDMTITASRSYMIDFSQPYYNSRGGVYIIRLKEEQNSGWWIWVKVIGLRVLRTLIGIYITICAMIYFYEAANGRNIAIWTVLLAFIGDPGSLLPPSAFIFLQVSFPLMLIYLLLHQRDCRK